VVKIDNCQGQGKWQGFGWFPVIVIAKNKYLFKVTTYDTATGKIKREAQYLPGFSSPLSFLKVMENVFGKLYLS
jgi:hypothetical protein